MMARRSLGSFCKKTFVYYYHSIEELASLPFRKWRTLSSRHIPTRHLIFNWNQVQAFILVAPWLSVPGDQSSNPRGGENFSSFGVESLSPDCHLFTQGFLNREAVWIGSITKNPKILVTSHNRRILNVTVTKYDNNTYLG